MELNHAGRSQIGEIARIRIVDSDTKHVHISRIPNRSCCGFQLRSADTGKGVYIQYAIFPMVYDINYLLRNLGRGIGGNQKA